MSKQSEDEMCARLERFVGEYTGDTVETIQRNVKRVRSRHREMNNESNDGMEDESSHSTSSSVSWGKKVRVVLVPCRNDYHAGGVAEDLWWQSNDYTYFKDDAKAEVFEVMKQNQCSAPEAIQQLYRGVSKPEKNPDRCDSPSSTCPSSADRTDCSSPNFICEENKSNSGHDEFLAVYAQRVYNPRRRGNALPYSGNA